MSFHPHIPIILAQQRFIHLNLRGIGRLRGQSYSDLPPRTSSTYWVSALRVGSWIFEIDMTEGHECQGQSLGDAPGCEAGEERRALEARGLESSGQRNHRRWLQTSVGEGDTEPRVKSSRGKGGWEPQDFRVLMSSNELSSFQPPKTSYFIPSTPCWFLLSLSICSKHDSQISMGTFLFRVGSRPAKRNHFHNLVPNPSNPDLRVSLPHFPQIMCGWQWVGWTQGR